MDANPFDKKQFQCHRDWEESLVSFFAREARNPDVKNWLSLATGLEEKRTVAFSALLLSDLLEIRPGFFASAEKFHDVYKVLNEPEGGAEKFEEWLRAGWLNVSRVANMMDAELRH